MDPEVRVSGHILLLGIQRVCVLDIDIRIVIRDIYDEKTNTLFVCLGVSLCQTLI